MRARIVLLALALSTFLFVTTETLPIGLLPLIAHGLGVTTSAVGLLVTAYGLVVVVASVPLTRLTTRWRRRRLLAVLLAVFVVATAAAAAAPNYPTLLVARVVTALGQALFWAIITPAAAALFRPEVRGRAVSVLYAGSSVAALVGVPAGTWLGQQAGWRTAFLALSATGLVALATVATLMPDTAPGTSDADRGSAPDAGRYWSMVVTTALAVTGAFTAFTYVSPFLTDVSGFGAGAVGPVLLLRGLAGLAGVLLAGFLVDRDGWRTMAAIVGVQTVALAGQFLAGATPVGAVAMVAVSGFALAGISAALGARVLEVAPATSDMAAAGTSTAFNVGITAGALLGSVLLDHAGVRSTALAGSVLSLLALAAVLAEPAMARRPAIERP
ncbi:MAG TPA: MFS transporter [Micromonosporaceae bacterium]|jgi:MFS transporter, DHA1 family, inner membrane transport protein